MTLARCRRRAVVGAARRPPPTHHIPHPASHHRNTTTHHRHQLLAFMVLSLVWICEVDSVISVRTALSIRFFPRIFFLYFTLFHIYFFSFPFGFSHLALLTTMALLVHAMLYFWNRFEVRTRRPSTPPQSQTWKF